MKVTKDMLHEELQPLYSRLNWMPKMCSSRFIIKAINYLMNRGTPKDIEGLDCETIYVPSSDDDYQIRVQVYRPKNYKENHQGKLPLLFYIHGGGYISGNTELSSYCIEEFIKHRPCVVVAPNYRKALTKPFPAGFNDSYDTLLWAKNNAESLGVYDKRIMVGGHSAGGGLTAAVTLKARDTGDVDIAFQMPFYPMLDDQQPYDPKRAIDSPVWNTTSNKFGWEAYLADLLKAGKEIPAYASPTRNSDYRDFPPTITFVGDLDPFLWETESYVQALQEQGVEVAHKVYKRCYHAFELIAQGTSISDDALAFTYDNFSDFYDRFVISQLD